MHELANCGGWRWLELPPGIRDAILTVMAAARTTGHGSLKKETP